MVVVIQTMSTGPEEELLYDLCTCRSSGYLFQGISMGRLIVVVDDAKCEKVYFMVFLS